MKLILNSNAVKDPGNVVLNRVLEFLKDRGCETLVLPMDGREPIDQQLLPEEALADATAFISLGGDGTFLMAAHMTYKSGVPLIGINLGSVGFLTEIRLERLEADLDKLIRQDYQLEERMLLKVECFDADNNKKYEQIALNEALLARRSYGGIIPVHLYFNAVLVDKLRCDATLLATPTGSTAYAMAAGGPIIHPGMDLILMTPVCPYALQNRSYVIQPETEVRMDLGSYAQIASLSVDGRYSIDFLPGDSVIVTKAERKLKLLRLHEDRFFLSLPEKLKERAEGGR